MTLKKGDFIARDRVLFGGIDLGNGTMVADIEGLTAYLISGYSEHEPMNHVKWGKTGLLKDTIFSCNLGGVPYWYGNGLVGNGLVRRLDLSRFEPEYIRRSLSGLIIHWVRSNKLQTDHTLRLKLMFGLPPAIFYDNPENVKRARKAIKEAFKHTDSNQWIITQEGKGKGDTYRLNVIPEFLGFQPEAVAVGLSEVLDPGYTVVVDGGGDTLDLGLFHSSQPDKPLQYKTEHDSLLKAFGKIRTPYLGDVEAGILSGEIDKSYLDSVYFEAVMNRIAETNRKLMGKNQPIKFQFVGGLCKLITERKTKLLSDMGLKVVMKGIEANATAFRKLAQKESTNG